MRSLLAAFSFLTILPVPGRIHTDRQALAAAPRFYPLVGATLGFASFMAFHLLEPAPALLRAVALAIVPIVLTRAIHVDGLGDTLDGLLAAGTPARRREVMRDPRLGTFGVLGIVFDVLARVSLYASLAPSMAGALIAAPLTGRVALVFALTLAPYGRSGRLKAAGVQPKPGGIGLALLVPVLFCLVWPGLRLEITIGAAAAAGLSWSWVSFVRRRLGEVSGDTLGALNEFVEILVLAVFLSVPLFRQ